MIQRIQTFVLSFLAPPKRRWVVAVPVLLMATGLFHPPLQAAVATFREGVASYSSTKDTYLDEEFPGNSYENSGSVLVENNGGQRQHGLIRFENIFGGGAGQIPLGSIINSASLSVNVTNSSSSSAQIRFHRMLVTWPENSTWTSMTGGIQTNDSEALSAHDAQVAAPASSGPETITGLAAALQAWSLGSPNHGWAIISNSSDGWDFDSSEDGTVGNRPLLTVDWGPAYTISGMVFEDANFAGTASGYDGGGGDKALAGVDVELYNAGTDAYITSTTTIAGGIYSFSGLGDGTSYKIRVRSATIGSGAATPKGGLWATVPGTWPFPLPEMTWGNGAVLYGGQSATVDDTATGDNAGPGDTYLTVGISGADVTGVDFGFAYNLIVNTLDDSIADTARSVQGGLRQFIKNANAIATAGGTTASSSEFRMPTSDPNYSIPNGVFTITPPILLPALADAGTTLDASTQGDNTTETNGGNLGVGGKVGVDQLDLSTVPAPEVEIAGSGTLVNGIRIAAGNATIRGLSIYGFDQTATGDGGIHLADGISGGLIEQNVIGSRAHVFADPGAGFRNWENVYSDGADNVTVRNNLIGFGGIRGILIAGGSTGWTIEDNEVRDCSLNDPFGDGIAIDPGQAAVTGNLVIGAASQGIVVRGSTGSTFTNNTVSGNGIGTPAASGNAAGMTLRGTASGHTVELNEFTANYGAGLSVNDGATGIKITKNSFSGNGTIVARNGDPATGQIGIDLNNPTDDASAGTAPFVSLNDPGDSLPGGNNLLNYPVLDTARIFGSSLELTGWAPADSVIEVYLRDADPSLFGEGQTYRITLTEDGTGSGGEDPFADLDSGPPSMYSNPVNGINQGTDTTNRFRFSFPLPPGVTVGTELTATARDGSNNTSEFSGRVTVALGLTIVKRAFQSDGTPIASGSSLPSGMPVKFLLYIDNPAGAATDISLQDVLDPLFDYQVGSMRVGNTLVSSVVCPGGVCDEGAIFAQVDGSGTPLGDGDASVPPVDADEGSYNSGARTIDLGDSTNTNNAQLDLAGDRVWALLFTIAMQ